MHPRPLRPFLAWCLAASALLALAFATYRASLEVPFLWDDEIAIVRNPRLARLWPFGDAGHALETPEDGRPVVRLTLALNHALGGLEVPGEGPGARIARSFGIGRGALAVRGYHWLNLALHWANALLLAALVRATLRRLSRWSAAADGLGWLVAALWLVHPLQSEAVTYVIQRTELLMALAYLATLLCAARALEERRRALWSALAVLACALGMASKEAMASAPLAVALYDRAFAFPSWRAAWARRRSLYLGLVSTWLVLGALVAGGPRAQSVGFGLGVAWWEYARLQVGVLGDYLRLALWPSELLFDYGTAFSTRPGPLLPGALVLAAVLLATGWALVRRPQLAFLPAAALLVLAPSSSVVPIVSEIGAERRAYLPLAALIVALVLATHAGLARFLAPARAMRGVSALALVLVGLLAHGTTQRLHDYRSALAIWRDAARLRPDNPRARNHVGRELLHGGRPDEALAEFSAAMALPGCELEAFNNAGHALAALGRREEALAHFRDLVAADPTNCGAQEGRGVTAMELERWAEAVEALERCRALGCATANVLNNLGRSLYFLGRGEEALAAFEAALVLEPTHAAAAENLGKVRERLANQR
ncbi:MAG TPA: tetratricopeptide repeat protein [Planctomycetota bacterium]